VYLVEGMTLGGMYRNAGAQNGRPKFQRYKEPPACIYFDNGWKVRLETDEGTAHEPADAMSHLPPTGTWGPLQVSCRSSPFFVVDGATDDESVMNGRYACIGIFNGRPKYKRLGSHAIIYFDTKWKINKLDEYWWYFWHPNTEALMPPVGLWERYDSDFATEHGRPAPTLTAGTQFMRGDSPLILLHHEEVDWSEHPTRNGATWIEPGERRPVGRVQDAWYLEEGWRNLWVPFSAAVLEHTESVDGQSDSATPPLPPPRSETASPEPPEPAQSNEPVLVYRVQGLDQLSGVYVQNGMRNSRARYTARGRDAELFFDNGWRLSAEGLTCLAEGSSSGFPPTGRWQSEGGETVTVSCRASPFFIVRGAGSDSRHSRVNGRYACVGIFMGKPKYKQVDGDGILYWRGFWKMTYEDNTGGWFYSYPDSDSSLPPTGTWTTHGYSHGAGALPAPEVSVGRTEDLRVDDRVMFMRSGPGSLSYSPGYTQEIGQIREDGFFAPKRFETLWAPLSTVSLVHDRDLDLYHEDEPSGGAGADSHTHVEGFLEGDSVPASIGDQEEAEGSEAAQADAFECGHDEDWADEVERFKCPI
ncbi:traf6-b, partial [Symbiodinium sp. CCMP2456]